MDWMVQMLSSLKYVIHGNESLGKGVLYKKHNHAESLLQNRGKEKLATSNPIKHLVGKIFQMLFHESILMATMSKKLCRTLTYFHDAQFSI